MTNSLQKFLVSSKYFAGHTITFPHYPGWRLLTDQRNCGAERPSRLQGGQDGFVFRSAWIVLHLLRLHGHHSDTGPLVHGLYFWLIRPASLPTRPWSCEVGRSTLFWHSDCTRENSARKVTWERSKAQSWVASAGYISWE